MRDAEVSGRAAVAGPVNALTPANPSDPESFKVRKGKVGGYAEYLSKDDISWLSERLADLHPFLAHYYGTSKQRP